MLPRSRVDASNSSCIPRQMPSIGMPLASSSPIRPSSSRSRMLRIAFGNAPTPGSTAPSDARMVWWSLVITGRAPVRSSAFSTERRLPIP